MAIWMQPVWDAMFSPFVEFAFMRRALVATLALSLSAAPLGVFLTLRRMSLLGDALSHAVLPGVAIGFMVSGLSLLSMALGGVVAGLLVAGIAGAVSRLGVTLISQNGTQLDLLHILFGSALGVDNAGLLLVAGVATASVLLLASMYRGLVLETFDPVFLAANHRGHGGRISKLLGPWVWHQGFLMLVVVNLVAGFQTLGTLMAVGLMMLPAVSARLWHDTLPAQLVNASAQAALAGSTGLLLSYHFDTPSGPTIIGCAGVLYFVSLLVAPGGWLPRLWTTQHRVA